MHLKAVRGYFPRVISLVSPSQVKSAAKIVLFNLLEILMSVFVWQLFGIVLFVSFFNVFYHFTLIEFLLQVIAGLALCFFVNLIFNGKDFYLQRADIYSNYEIAKNIIQVEKEKSRE